MIQFMPANRSITNVLSPNLKLLWLWITNEGSVPEMRIWSILLIKSDLKWCIYLSRSLFLYSWNNISLSVLTYWCIVLNAERSKRPILGNKILKSWKHAKWQAQIIDWTRLAYRRIRNKILQIRSPKRSSLFYGPDSWEILESKLKKTVL